MSIRACRINVILSLGLARVAGLTARELQALASDVVHDLIPERLNCFIRLAGRFSPDDLEEFSASARGEGLLVVSEDLVTDSGTVQTSPIAKAMLERARKVALPLGLIGLVRSEATSDRPIPPGLDAVVPMAEPVAAALAEAVRGVAARLWLTLPSHGAKPPAGSESASRVVIDFPRNEEEFLKVLGLRYQVYRLLGYLPGDIVRAKSEADLDAYDPDAIHLLARDEATGEVLGCARLIVPNCMLAENQRRAMGYGSDVARWCQNLARRESDKVYRSLLARGAGGQPLPAASMGAYQTLRQRLLQSHAGLRAEDCCELSRLIVAPKARGHQLARRLIETAVQIVSEWMPRRIMLVECREHHRGLYENFQFQLIDSAVSEAAGRLRTSAIALWRDLKKSPERSARSPNAHVVLTGLGDRTGPPERLASEVRGALPLESWVWSRQQTQVTEKAVSSAFELSLYNEGLVRAVVGGFADLLRRLGGRRLSLCDQCGHSVELLPSGTTAASVDSAVLDILKLLAPTLHPHA